MHLPKAWRAVRARPTGTEPVPARYSFAVQPERLWAPGLPSELAQVREPKAVAWPPAQEPLRMVLLGWRAMARSLRRDLRPLGLPAD